MKLSKEVKTMAWDGDALAGQMEEVLERQQLAADARAVRGTSTPNERARSAKFESLRVSRSRLMTQLEAATNPSHRTVLERGLKSINDQMAEDETSLVTPRTVRADDSAT